MELKEILHSFSVEMPTYIDGILILIIGLILAKLIYLAVYGILKLLKFDNICERVGFLDFIKNHVSDIPSRILAKIAYWIIITLALCLVVSIFGFIDTGRTELTIIRLISQIIAFSAFLVVNFYILSFAVKIFDIILSLISFKYHKTTSVIIFTAGAYGIIYYSLPILNFNDQMFFNATFFILKCLAVIISAILIWGFRDAAYNIYLYLMIKFNYKIGDHLIIDTRKYVINNIQLFSVTLLSSENEIILDNKKFYENIIKKI